MQMYGVQVDTTNIVHIEEILKEMGIDTIPISRAEISHAEIGRTQIGNSLQRVNYETIDLKLVKRGIIGVNKVGYVIG